MCDEVIGEIKVITEEDFQKVQRPIEGYTLEEYISNMVSFNKQYTGKFIFEITIVKGYNDDEASVQKLKEVTKSLSPSKVIVVRMEDEPFKKKLGISDERYAEITQALLSMKTTLPPRNHWVLTTSFLSTQGTWRWYFH